jgi:hypothetical protein
MIRNGPDFLDNALGRLFAKPKKPKRKYDPDYARFRRLCKKHALTYTVADDGYVDIETPDGARFAIGESWDQRVMRLEAVLETGYDPGHSEIAWPAKVKMTKIGVYYNDAGWEIVEYYGSPNSLDCVCCADDLYDTKSEAISAARKLFNETPTAKNLTVESKSELGFTEIRKR